jgi:hypothetical protein
MIRPEAEGARNAKATRFRGSEPILAELAAHSGLMRVREISQGKPQAKLFWPPRATDWNVQIADLFRTTGPGPHFLFAIYRLATTCIE